VNDNVEETLGWEAEQRPRAGLAAMVSGLLIVVANGWVLNLFGDFPRAPLVDVMREAATGDRAIKNEQVQYLDDHAFGVLLGDASVPPGGLLSAISFIAMSFALYYLYRATAARHPQIPRAMRILVVAGPVTAAVGALMTSIGRIIAANDYLGSDDKTPEAARDALLPAATQAGQILLFAGVFALAIGIVFVALNAMRAGLLTRFLGVLGVISGVIWVVPLDPLGLVRALWLIFLGFLILGRSPGGVPAAWQTGRAEPWPTQQQIREQREAAKAPAEAPQAPAPAAAPRQPQRQKRKRRK
jgi:hypothetical protein